MNRQLNMIDRTQTGLAPETLTALTRQVRALAALCRREGRGGARLVLTCVSALTAQAVDHPAVQSFLGCLMGSRAWAAVSGELTAAQYAAQLLLNEAAEQGLICPGLAVTAKNRLGGTAPGSLTAFLTALAQQPDDGVTPVISLSGSPLPEALSYHDFITFLAEDTSFYAQVLKGRKFVRMPEESLLPLAGAELLCRLDGDHAPRLAAAAAGEHLTPVELKSALLRRLVARQIGADAPRPARDLLIELTFCIRAAEAEGLFASAGTPADFEDPLRWETRIFHTLCAMNGGRGFAGSGSGSGSGRFGSGRPGSGSGSFGGSGGCAPGVFEGGGLSGDGFGGVYGLELIDPPLSGERLLDRLLSELGA